MKATISADIVRSTSMGTADLLDLRRGLLGLIRDLEKDIPGFWARIVRGDCLECVVPDARDALRIAILLKLFVKMRVADFDCSEMLRRHGIRFSIAAGDLRYINRDEDIIDGPAIYLSGRNLDEISRKGSRMSIFEIDRQPRPLSNVLDSFVALVCDLADSYSAKQSAVVFYKLLGLKEVEISERLGIYQSSVNMRATSARWGLLNMSIRDFESFNLEELCG
jgi:hypothetical protein